MKASELATVPAIASRFPLRRMSILVALAEAQPVVRRGREEEDESDGRARRASRSRRSARCRVELVERAREADREQEAEEDVRARDERAELLEQLVVLALEPRLERFRALGFEHLALELVGIRRSHAGAATPIVPPERRRVAARVRLAEPVLVERADPEQELELVPEVRAHHLRAVRRDRERHLVLDERANRRRARRPRRAAPSSGGSRSGRSRA